MFFKYKLRGSLFSFLFVIIGNTLYSIGVYFFIQPIGMYVGGITGISQLTNTFLKNFGFPILPLGYITILYNLPLVIFGFLKLDKNFMSQTILSVIYVGFLLNFLPNVPIHQITDNLALNILFGGFIVGYGLGLTLRYGSSMGGTDIITNYLSYKKDTAVGTLNTSLNYIIVIAAFFLEPFNINCILMTILLIYYIGFVVNNVHTKHLKFTVFIISKRYSVITKNIYLRCGRGATLFKAKSGYLQQEQYVIMTVISSYKLAAIRNIIDTYDKEAFVNILPSKEVYGNFRKSIREVPIIYK